MAHPREAAADAVAFQLVALLEQYEGDADRLATTWLDMELYARVSREVEEMRLYCASLPQVSVAWVRLLIAHAELIHCLWKTGHSSGASPQVAQCSSQHGRAVTELRQKCLWLFSKMDQGQPRNSRH